MLSVCRPPFLHYTSLPLTAFRLPLIFRFLVSHHSRQLEMGKRLIMGETNPTQNRHVYRGQHRPQHAGQPVAHLPTGPWRVAPVS